MKASAYEDAAPNGLGAAPVWRVLCQGTTLHRKKPNGDGISDEMGSASSYRVTRARRTGNLRAVQLLLGHTKIESTVRYLGIEIDDAIEVAEKTEV